MMGKHKYELYKKGGKTSMELGQLQMLQVHVCQRLVQQISLLFFVVAKCHTCMCLIERSFNLNKFDFLSVDYLIGVHCNHGINRSGYMICR